MVPAVSPVWMGKFLAGSPWGRAHPALTCARRVMDGSAVARGAPAGSAFSGLLAPFRGGSVQPASVYGDQMVPRGEGDP